MSDKEKDLKKRVIQFRSFSLPGQPISMHMGTSYLVNDLWREIERLRAENKEATKLVKDLHDEGMSQDAFNGDQESIDLLVRAENWTGDHKK